MILPNTLAVCISIVPICGVIQLVVLLIGGNEAQVDQGFLERIERLEEVKVDLRLWNLFKSFKSSTLLILVYLFYCAVVLEHEIQSMFNFQDTQLDFLVVPIIYAGVHAALEHTRAKVTNLHMFSMVLMGLQITCSILDVVLQSAKVPTFISFGFFALNLALFQKLVFINVAVSLLNTFDIKNLRIANYVNGDLTSPREPDPVLYQRYRSSCCPDVFYVQPKG